MTAKEPKSTIMNPVLTANSTGVVSEDFNQENQDSLTINTATNLSEHEVSNKAFESIIKYYVLQIPNVVRFTSTSLRGTFAEIVGHKNEESSISIYKNEDQSINVTLAIIVTFDAHIPSLMDEVENIIRERILEYTDIRVQKVRICIQDIIPSEETEDSENFSKNK